MKMKKDREQKTENMNRYNSNIKMAGENEGIVDKNGPL